MAYWRSCTWLGLLAEWTIMTETSIWHWSNLPYLGEQLSSAIKSIMWVKVVLFPWSRICFGLNGGAFKWRGASANRSDLHAPWLHSVICQRVEQNTNHVHQSAATNVCFVAFFANLQIYNLLCVDFDFNFNCNSQESQSFGSFTNCFWTFVQNDLSTVIYSPPLDQLGNLFIFYFPLPTLRNATTNLLPPQTVAGSQERGEAEARHLMHFSDTCVVLIDMSFMLIPGQAARQAPKNSLAACVRILTGYKMCLVQLE